MPTLASLALTCLCAGEPPVDIRGLYGGYPAELLADGQTLAEWGINAVWIGSGGIRAEQVEALHAQGVLVFAEFNTLHVATYLKDHPDAAPVGPDGRVGPPPEGWQGVSPTHEGYRQWRMAEFRKLLETVPVDGVWLDYHHAQASWERAEPLLPDTGFDPRSLRLFERDTGLRLPARPIPEVAKLLLGDWRDEWVAWWCDVLTDWVREFAEIRNEVRPSALLGSFHCPWTDTERDGALRRQLWIDLRAQAEFLDVFSPMPYHARFGHAGDVDWIARQVAWLGDHLAVRGEPTEWHRIWPIVQVADWGDPVPVEEVAPAIRAAARRPSTGLLLFHWSGLRESPEKLEAVRRAYLELVPPAGGGR